MGLILDLSPKSLEKILYFVSYVVLDPGTTSLEFMQVLSEKEYQNACDDFGRENFRVGMGAWFRDYVYYSVLRSKPVSEINKKIRKSSREKKKLVNKLITVGGLIVTWGCIGFWHGASLNYMGHAMWHAFFIIAAILLEDYYERLRVFFKIKEDSKAFDLFRTLKIR